jgi:deoxyribonucleoside regulator
MDDIRLLTKVATLYYKAMFNQQEIAQRLGVSRQTIGRYLKRAQDLGIVRIRIDSNLEYSTELEYQLEKAFHLSEVIVVTPPVETEESVKEALGEAGAAFLQRRVLPNDIIGVAWSSTVLQCALHLPRLDSRQVTVVQLNGSENRNLYSTSSERIVEQIARAFNGTTENMVAPMLVDHASIKYSLLSDSRIAASLELASRSQLALFGVGIVSEKSSLYKAGYLDDDLLEKLRKIGAVGEILGRFYDAQGKICMEELNERTIAVDLENLKTKRISTAVAAGHHKVEAILGMIRGGYCNVLITCKDTAQILLSRADSSNLNTRRENQSEMHSLTVTV